MWIITAEIHRINVSGISGLATKTSYIMFLLQAVMQSPSAQKTASIIFNVKAKDLLSIDKPSSLTEHNTEQWESIKREWEKCGLEAKPFENVRYFFPYTNKEDKWYADTWSEADVVRQLCRDGNAGNYIYRNMAKCSKRLRHFAMFL
jgi:hypothetical protein